jgi:V/A-type H+-transporting ATPase subunit E
MQNKLQELTDKLYNDGLAKGKEEGDKYLAQARQEAEKIVEEAKAKAAQIVSKAEKDAADLAGKAKSDIRMASEQALQATRKDIENILTDSIVKEGTAKALADEDLLKEIILAVAKNFSAQESADLEVVLPESLKKELEPWVSASLAKNLKGGVKASFSKKVAGGFTIGPADGGWFVSLTDETFVALIGEYLRPITKKLLFGE